MDDFSTMHPKPYEELNYALERLTLFRALLDTPPVLKLCILLDELTCESVEAHNVTWAYHELVASLLALQPSRVTGDNWKDFILQMVVETDHLFSTLAVAGERNPSIENAMRNDLSIMQTLFLLDDAQVREWCHVASGLDTHCWVGFTAQNPIDYADSPLGRIRRALVQSEDWSALIDALYAFFQENGSGVFLLSRAFVFTAAAGLTPLEDVRWPAFESLAGYGSQKRAMEENLERFAAGRPGTDILLIGETGTGRFTLMMAIIEAMPQVTLIKMEAAVLSEMTSLFERLRRQPGRFLLYIEELNEGVSPLLTLLENSVSTRPANILIAAALPPAAFTTGWWGMSVRFDTPDESLYAEMVRSQLMLRGHHVPEDVLLSASQQWATDNGRTGRSASRCAEWLAENVEIAQD